MRKLMIRLLACCVVVTVVAQEPASLSDAMIQAYQQHRPYDPPSVGFPNLTMPQAYAIQKAYVQRRLMGGDKITGFKAAASGQKPPQDSPTAGGPVVGVLFESGRQAQDLKIDRSTYVRPMLETEIGFIIGKKIVARLNGIPELRSAVRSIVPVIEVPDLAWPEGAKTNLFDLVAINAASSHILVGERPQSTMDLNTVQVALSRDGNKIGEGAASGVMGDQWTAALWTVNQAITQGYTVEPGHVIIGGTITRLAPADPGKYVADYGAFGKIEFEVR